MGEEAGNPPAITGYAAMGDTFLDVWRDNLPVPEKERVMVAILLLVQQRHGDRSIKGPCELVIILPPHEAEVDGEVRAMSAAHPIRVHLQTELVPSH